MKKLLLLLVGIMFFGSFGYAYTVINFDEYKEALEEISTRNLDYYKEKREFKEIRDTKCGMVEKGDYYIISPICLRKKEYPELGFREAVDYIRPYIESFEQEYDLINQEFTFEGTKPIINYSEISLMNQYHETAPQLKIITELEKNMIKIKIHKKYFARYSIENFSFYPVRKNFEGISNCALTNYKVGIKTMSGYYLKANEILNFNENISYQPGYCKGSSDTNRPFYGGVCGSAGQLFRTSLIIPDITVTQRLPHSKRRSQYYGKIIYGDDAAVLDTRKKLEIRNDGDLPIYYKILDKGNYNYLVGILPIKSDKFVHVTKQQTGPLSAIVIKKTFSKINGTLENIQEFISKYITVSTSSV